MNSSLAEDHRLVALDLRGHGLSDKPRDGYDDSRLWADDVDAVIRALNLDHPVLCGWSYGPLVFLDYIRHYGEDRIGGLHFVGAVTKLGSEEAMSVLTPEFLSLVPQFFSTDTETASAVWRACSGCASPRSPPPPSCTSCWATTSPSRRTSVRGCSRASFDNDDLLPKIRKPVLITHGAADAIVKPSAVDQHQAAMPHAQVQLMANAGHAAFWDDAAAFNERLHAFCETL